MKLNRQPAIVNVNFKDESVICCETCNINKPYYSFRLKYGSKDERLKTCETCSTGSKSPPDSLNQPHVINRKKLEDNFKFY
jgi:hypothetical protein